MHVLIGWDDEVEARRVARFLQSPENVVRIAADTEDLPAVAGERGWNAILMSLSFPTADEAYRVFLRLRELLPDCPVVAACRPDEIDALGRFISGGLRAHLVRDAKSEFLYHVQGALSSAREAIRAEKDPELAERLRQEIESVRRLQQRRLDQDDEDHEPIGPDNN